MATKIVIKEESAVKEAHSPLKDNKKVSQYLLDMYNNELISFDK